MAIELADMALTGPGTLAGRYLRHYWQPIYVANELPANRAKPVRIMSEDLTLYRGESGTPYAVAFRCAHRNTQLSTGWVRGENIRCLYHGWAYNGDGQCVEQPAEPEPFCEKVSIRSYPVEEYLGLIFAYLGEGEPPPLPRFEELENSEHAQAFRNPPDDCNWFTRLDQTGDIVHPFFAHPQIMRHAEPPQVRTEETTFGLTVYADYEDGSQQLTHFHMPNANMFGGGRSNLKAIAWRMPIDDDHYFSIGVSERPQVVADASYGTTIKELGDAILRGDLTVDEIIEHPAAVSIQDYVVLVGQGPITERAPDRLGREDLAVIAVRKIWERDIKAFSEGEAPTRWYRTGPSGPVYLPPATAASV